NYLERYALELANTDAILLGDGGNAYTLGQPELREFLAEYRRLPPIKFADVSAVSSPAVVRALIRDRDYLFYAVNRTADPINLAMHITGAQSVERLATNEEIQTQNGLLILSLQPFQLVAFKTSTGARIVNTDASRSSAR